MKKIHTGTNFTKFGDGFFSVFNPDGEKKSLDITTSNIRSDHRNTVRIPAKLGQFQCLQVTKNILKINLKFILGDTNQKRNDTQT